jgi:motility quorum-sensing regulator/GCU-specific mRNA interferase toxin
LEKGRPHCKLATVKLLIQQGRIRATFSAIRSAAPLGYDFDGIVNVISGLTSHDFYKSMTTHADHRIWQDVYRPHVGAQKIYLKLTVIDDVLIVSFKEL